MHQQGKVASTDPKKAKFFRQFFDSVFNPKSEKALAYSVFAKIYLIYQLSEANIMMAKLYVKKARADVFVNFFLKLLAWTLCRSLQLLFTTFIKKLKSANLWKTSEKTPINKNGDKTSILNFRPIKYYASSQNHLRNLYSKTAIER